MKKFPAELLIKNRRGEFHLIPLQSFKLSMVIICTQLNTVYIMKALESEPILKRIFKWEINKDRNSFFYLVS